MRTRFALLVLFAVGCRPGGTSNVNDEPLRVAPARVEFEPTFIGATRRHTVTVTNPARTTHAVTSALAAPFAVPSSELSIGGGDSMAGDSARQRTVLFGGKNNTTSLSDTWERDDAGWVQLADGPSLRASGAAFDPLR